MIYYKDVQKEQGIKNYFLYLYHSDIKERKNNNDKRTTNHTKQS